MSWVDAALGVSVALLLGLGLVLGGILVARSPKFWFDVGMLFFDKIAPALLAFITRRMKPEDEERLHQTIRQGREWDPVTKRPRERK